MARVVGVHKRDLTVVEQGIDAYIATVDEARQARAGFVVAYLGSGSKVLTRARAVEYSRAQLDIVSVFETTANRALEGHAAGVEDAHAGRSQGTSCAQPGSAPVYYTADIDTSRNPAEILPYYEGLRSVAPAKLLGAYGGIDTIRILFDHGLIGFGYQTAAWSYGKWDPRAQLRQTGYGRVYDTDAAVQRNFGQWRAR